MTSDMDMQNEGKGLEEPEFGSNMFENPPFNIGHWCNSTNMTKIHFKVLYIFDIFAGWNIHISIS